MWIDGERVSLKEFGTADKWLYGYQPAGGRDVILREWRVTLAQPTPGPAHHPLSLSGFEPEHRRNVGFHGHKVVT